MSPITHGLLSYALAEQLFESDRDRALVTLAGILPDLDGLGVLVDVGNHWLGRPPTDFYTLWHHFLLHGLVGCLLLALGLAALAQQRGRVFWAALVIAHLHLLCDLVGSRGPDPTDLWPIFYLGPFSWRLELKWSGQWRLDGWQNVSLTLVLLVWLFRQAWKTGRSPLSLVSLRANQALVETLRRRFGPP